MKFFIFISCLFFALRIYSQDTLLHTPQIKFKEYEKNNYFSKGYHGLYGMEEVVFSETHKKIEHCYYIDGIRNCKSNEYFILNDSTLLINDSNSVWNFKPFEKNQYLLSKKNDFIYTHGIAKSIIPLIFSSKLYSINLLTGDTLFTTSYNYPKYFSPEGISTINPFKGHFKGKLYEYNEIDIAPTLLNGDSIPMVYLKEKYSLCYSEPYLKELTLISVIITQDGNIKMIDQAIGNYNIEHCDSRSYIYIVNFLSSLGKLKPALINGKPVNVRWFVKVHRFNNKIELHPVFEDNLMNRKNYIKKNKISKSNK